MFELSNEMNEFSIFRTKYFILLKLTCFHFHPDPLDTARRRLLPSAFVVRLVASAASLVFRVPFRAFQTRNAVSRKAIKVL